MNYLLGSLISSFATAWVVVGEHASRNDVNNVLVHDNMSRQFSFLFEDMAAIGFGLLVWYSMYENCFNAASKP